MGRIISRGGLKGKTRLIAIKKGRAAEKTKGRVFKNYHDDPPFSFDLVIALRMEGQGTILNQRLFKSIWLLAD
jgi:hypothetical protein